MATIIDLILLSGESAIQIALYILLPIMVVMMAIMSVLEDRGILKKIALICAPLLVPFGLPGLGVFAILQVLLISFAAPITTLRIMDRNEEIREDQIAATLAAILVMSQANATFPLAAVGLNIPVMIGTSILGGLLAGAIAFRLTKNTEDIDQSIHNSAQSESLKKVKLNDKNDKKSLIQVSFEGGEEALQITLKAIPPLILAIFFVNILRETGAIFLIEQLLSPFLSSIGIPGVAVLPIATKYLAGGTSMMAITLDLANKGLIDAIELNRFAGFTINTFDPVGVALILSAGTRVKKVFHSVFFAVIIGILFRGILHIIIF